MTIECPILLVRVLLRCVRKKELNQTQWFTILVALLDNGNGGCDGSGMLVASSELSTVTLSCREPCRGGRDFFFGRTGVHVKGGPLSRTLAVLVQKATVFHSSPLSMRNLKMIRSLLLRIYCNLQARQFVGRLLYISRTLLPVKITGSSTIACCFTLSTSYIVIV